MIYSKKVIALVPIKDHSERVSGKNFREFCGKPLYHHIINTLDKTYAIDEIIINTDSERINLEASSLSPKVTVHMRPDELYGDFVSTNTIFAYDLENSEADIYLQTHATNPLLKAETIANALRYFCEQEEFDSLFSVTEFKSRFYHHTAKAINHNPQELLRTQDLDSLYEENSCFYIFDKGSFASTNARIGKHPKLHVTPKLESIDIDDEVTWELPKF
ncbi:MAG: acylneuraminate cytidylyltransferase family protein [Lentisphaeria bacterium]|nr:acylneuraminate cytidylyltransferase family protein [Lentisphaeria bacterium]NQZ68846.1 acylneuraminate cytidylyltransferase family protein [Lentisphaeria bacterium]